jgi:hypothetical protein
MNRIRSHLPINPYDVIGLEFVGNRAIANVRDHGCAGLLSTNSHFLSEN